MSKYIELTFKDELATFRAASTSEQEALIYDAYCHALTATRTHDFKTDDVAARRTSAQFVDKFATLTGEEAFIYALNTARTYNPERVK